MESPNEETLRKMPYSELRKYARKSGIKGNRKADALIASILEKKSPVEDIFKTMESTLVNSSTKNKEKKFDSEKVITSGTPRRDTYTIDSPLKDIVNKEKIFNSDKAIASDTPRRDTYTIDSPLKDIVNNKELMTSSASPELKKSVIMNETPSNVTMTRGSEKKFKNRKVSFKTPIRKSERLSLLTPQFASVKDRPKTPIPSGFSSGIKKRSLSNTPYQADNKIKNRSVLGKVSGGDGKERRPSTPMPVSKSKTKKQSSSVSLSSLEKCVITPGLGASLNMESPLPLLKEVDSEKSIPRSAIKRSNTPSSSVRKANALTPNFLKMHEKVFDKMESLDEYAKRRTATAEKRKQEQEKFHIPGDEKRTRVRKDTKIPKPFGGIPFIPSAPNTKCNFVPAGRKPNGTPGNKSMAASFLSKESILSKSRSATTDKKKALKTSASENMSSKKKSIFDLKASLSKKLPYKPHRGPLKPLSEKNLNCTLQLKPSKTPEITKENDVVKANRIQSRSVLRGVRTNRRFELQMKNRKRISA